MGYGRRAACAALALACSSGSALVSAQRPTATCRSARGARRFAQARRWVGSSWGSRPPFFSLPKEKIGLDCGLAVWDTAQTMNCGTESRDDGRLTMKRRSEGLLLECTRCKVMKPRGQFRSRGGGQVSASLGFARSKKSWCRDCDKPVQAAAASLRRKRVRGSYTAQEVRLLWTRQRGVCNGCGGSLGVLGYHVDHVIAIAKGGLNVAANLQLLCPKCNLRKGAK